MFIVSKNLTVQRWCR